MLFGIDNPHQPGALELRETREPLDVMHEAYRITIRTVLIDGWQTEVFDVASHELQYALALDEAPVAG